MLYCFMVTELLLSFELLRYLHFYRAFLVILKENSDLGLVKEIM